VTGATQPPANPADVAALIESIDSLVMGITEAAIMRSMAQAQPCVANAWLREQYALLLAPRLDLLNQDTRQASLFLQSVIGESLANQGRIGLGYTGTKSLGKYLIDAGPRAQFGSELLPLAPRALLLGWLPEAQWLERGHLPSGSALRSGAWVNGMSASSEVRENGEWLASGVYLYPPASELDFERTGSKLRGPAVRSLIEQWIAYQSDNVVPAEFAGLNPRARLVANVGTYLGTGKYGIWQEGDPVLPGSKLATAANVQEQMLSVIETSGAACEAVWEQQTETAGAITEIAVMGAGQAAASAAAADKLAAEQAKLRQWAVVGGLGIAALLAARAIR